MTARLLPFATGLLLIFGIAVRAIEVGQPIPLALGGVLLVCGVGLVAFALRGDGEARAW